MATGIRPAAVRVAALVALALAGPPPASAQHSHAGFGGVQVGGLMGGRQVGAVPFGNGNFGFPRPRFWSGLIDQNFAIMRATSPFPNRFAAGIYNPRPYRPLRASFGYGAFSSPRSHGFFYGSYGLGYAPLGYGGYGYGYAPPIYSGYDPSAGSYIGPSSSQYPPQPPVIIIEREVVRERDGAESRRQTVEPGERAEPSGGEEGYYLAPGAGETPEDAVVEIRRAWLNGDYARLESRLPERGKMRVYLAGKYRYSVDAAEFARMTREAMARIDTISFTLDRVVRQGEGRAFVSGRHIYYDPEHRKNAVYVSYGLVREKGRWKIAEAGSSTEPVTAHAEQAR